MCITRCREMGFGLWRTRLLEEVVDQILAHDFRIQALEGMELCKVAVFNNEVCFLRHVNYNSYPNKMELVRKVIKNVL